MECQYCNKAFADDETGIANYRLHQNVCHKDKKIDEEKIFEDYRNKMIKQKDEYEKSKVKTGDSDLVFNAKERDAHDPY